MTCLSIVFPTGHYHATPWGQHVNEGNIAWPPESYRLLRCLIATWYLKADKNAFSYAQLEVLINALTEEEPEYYLPASIHAHTRHYMPAHKGKSVLVLDSFLKVDKDDPLRVRWNTELGDAEFALLQHLATAINYFGRAESLAIVEASRAWPQDIKPNALPQTIDENGEIDKNFSSNCDLVEVLAPIQASQWEEKRQLLLAQNTDKPNSKTRKNFMATIPASMTEALSVDSGQIQAAKWSKPPAGRSVFYARPPLSVMPKQMPRRPSRTQSKLPTVARFILAGKPRPQIFEAVKIAETMRLAAMAKWGFSNGSPNAPYVISGRDGNSKPLRDSQHQHAFWLPEDADRDGLIDHIVVYAASGFNADIQNKLGRLYRLWIERGARNDEGERGRKEWRLALEGFGKPGDFEDSLLLQPANEWYSVTPYLRPWYGPHTEKEIKAQVCRELEKRGYPQPECITFEPHHEPEPLANPAINVAGKSESKTEPVIKFRRVRTRRGLTQPDTFGCSLSLEFAEPLSNPPLALGYGAHFGLGLFAGRN